MTAKKSSLLARGVVKNDASDTEDLLDHENVDQENLEDYLRTVANYVGLPSSCKFIKTAHGNDAAIFDFSKKKQCIKPFIFKPVENPKSDTSVRPALPISITGDALVEPFVCHFSPPSSSSHLFLKVAKRNWCE